MNLELVRLIRVVINSFALILLGILACVMWQSNPAYSFIFALAAVDQFEDVYYYVYRRRLFPEWFMPFDTVFEMVLFGVGLGMMLFSISYYIYFETWFFKALLPLSILIMYSAVEDILIWRMPAGSRPRVPTPSTVMHYVCPKEKVREEKRFKYVRKKN